MVFKLGGHDSSPKKCVEKNRKYLSFFVVVEGNQQWRKMVGIYFSEKIVT